MSFWEDSFTRVHESYNKHFTKCVMFVTLSTKWVTRGFGLNVRRRLHVRHPFPISEHVCRRLKKTPSCSFSQVDMYDYLSFRIMDEYPETKPIFARVNGHDVKSPEFAAHSYRVMNALDVLINLLYDTPALEKMASHLAVQHARRSGLKREHFAVSTEYDCIYL